MKKHLQRAATLFFAIALASTLCYADTNPYRIEIKSKKFSKHTEKSLWGITYTEDNSNYTNAEWPLVELSHAYQQNQTDQDLAKYNIVRQFGVSMGVVYWIDLDLKGIQYWNTVTGEVGRITPSKSYGIGYQDGIDNPNFDFTFYSKRTGSGAITHDWYGNLVHVWNFDDVTSPGHTADKHYVRGYAVYKAAPAYGQLMDFIPKLSKLDDDNAKIYPYYKRRMVSSSEMEGADDTDISNFDYIAPESGQSNPNYPADLVNWDNYNEYHKANDNADKQPTDFLAASGNLWGKGILQDKNAKTAHSSFYHGYSTGQVFHARGNIAFGNMFADGQYTNWYLNYRLYAKNPIQEDKYPVASPYWTQEDFSQILTEFIPGTESTDNYKTEYLFRETDVLEYFWNTPGAGTTEFDIINREKNTWHGYTHDLNYSNEFGTNDEGRVMTDMMSSPEVDSIKGIRVYIHNRNLNNSPSVQAQRNGMIQFQYSNYSGEMSTNSEPVFTGTPTHSYTPFGHSHGYNLTENTPVKYTNTAVNCWNELERVNNNVFALYTHVPGLGFSKYFITAVRQDNPVQNLNVDVGVNSAGNVTHRIRFVPQKYDRESIHTYEIWYRIKKTGGTTSDYETEYKKYGNSNRPIWKKLKTLSIKYDGATDSTEVSDITGELRPNAQFYKNKTLTYTHVANPGTDADGNVYARDFEYVVIPIYDRSGHRGIEKKITQTTTPAEHPLTGKLYQLTDNKNYNGIKVYGFNLRFLPTAVDENNSDIYSKAATMVVVPLDDTTTEELQKATKVAISDGNSITISSDKESFKLLDGTVTINGYHYTIKNLKLKDDGSLPHITWTNVNPDKEYKVKYYIFTSETDNSNSIYYIPSKEIPGTMIAPAPEWSLTDAGFYKLIGDYSSLATNEDMPIGTFRRTDPKTNELDLTTNNTVTLNNANYYGTNGSALKPLAVSKSVMGTLNSETGLWEDAGWEISYTLEVYDGYVSEENKGTQVFIKELGPQNKNKTTASYYSNINDVICDIVGIKAPYTETEAKDGRMRKIYAPEEKTYTAKVTVNYKRISDGVVVTRYKTSPLRLGTTSLPELGVKNPASSAVQGALFQRNGSHFYYNGIDDNGYFPYYYDATMLFNWEEDTQYNRYMGFYGASKATCYGHYESDGNGNRLNNEWVQYHAGQVLLDSEVDLLNEQNAALTGGKIGYDGTSNWSAQAIASNRIPLMIHYVHGANNPLSGETEVASVKFDVELTAEYPIVIYNPEKFCNTKIAESPDSYRLTASTRDMYVLTVPTDLSNMYVTSSTITTGVEGILTKVCGDVRLYPNPVGSSFTLKAPMPINEVKILTMTGVPVMTITGCDGTTATINVDELPQGMYIVNTLGTAQIMIKQ